MSPFLRGKRDVRYMRQTDEITPGAGNLYPLATVRHNSWRLKLPRMRFKFVQKVRFRMAAYFPPIQKAYMQVSVKLLGWAALPEWNPGSSAHTRPKYENSQIVSRGKRTWIDRVSCLPLRRLLISKSFLRLQTGTVLCNNLVWVCKSTDVNKIWRVSGSVLTFCWGKSEMRPTKLAIPVASGQSTSNTALEAFRSAMGSATMQKQAKIHCIQQWNNVWGEERCSNSWGRNQLETSEISQSMRAR